MIRRKGPKVKELARELGVTSRQLIDRCRQEGWPVQNSITRLDEDRAEIIRRWYRGASPPVSNESSG